MISLKLQKIASILNAKRVGDDVIIKTVSVDSNQITEQCMFIALVGKRFDGHNFAEQAVMSGAQALLVNYYLSLNIPQLVVENTYRALMQLAMWVRAHVPAKVIAITGSSGKTSVKEMTTLILKGCGKVVSTKDNCNNLIGVSITLLQLTKQDDFAVIELGSSNSGELCHLSKMVAADIALINNIYPSHLLGFKSLDAIKREKGEIFSNLSNHGHVIINSDNYDILMWNFMLKNKKIWNFSLNEKVNIDYFSSNIIYFSNGMQFVLNTPYGKALIFLPMLGIHNVANALAASALAFSAGVDFSKVVIGLQNIQSIPGRLYPIFLNKGKLLLDDTYNSNVGSMIAAIKVLSAMSGYRILVISDMLELGTSKTVMYHRYIGRLIKKTNINHILTIGDISYIVIETCKIRGKHFQNKMQLILYLRSILLKKKCFSVLVKGSRQFHMEQVVYAIQDHFQCYSG